jgi:TolA-binding protein
MTIRTLFLSASLSLALVAGCHKSADSQVEKMVTMMEDLGNAVDKSGDDCTKMASGVESVVKKYEGDLKDMKEASEKLKGNKEEAQRIQKKYGDRMEKVLPKMMGMMKCADDPKMKALNDKLRGLM